MKLLRENVLPRSMSINTLRNLFTAASVITAKVLKPRATLRKWLAISNLSAMSRAWLYCRAMEGQEYCLADIETLREFAGPYGQVITQEGYERHFERWWRVWKRHVIRKDLPEWAQNIIARIESRGLAESAILARDVQTVSEIVVKAPQL